MKPPALNLRFPATLALGLLSAAAIATELIVVEDRGGVSARPYYPALNPQDAEPAETPVTSPARPAPRIGAPADAEAALLPVRSERLSPGLEPDRVIHAPGLTPLFLIGDDERSRAWLLQMAPALRELGAFGLVVQVDTPAALADLRRLAPGLTLSPVSGDDLAQRLGVRHYPVLITATRVRGQGSEDRVQRTEDRGQRTVNMRALRAR
ncbi:MAG: integrating conjugative element protein [Candidatus Accumulibacter sp.]|jgi:integrating conjugative element protein (TIGR03765 family)|nr:integrating conjugative element protein [Accumulibacter sp.]